MTQRNRVFLGLVGIFVVAFAFLTYRIATDLDPRYREPAEDGLVETAQLLASQVELDLREGAIDTANLEQLFSGVYSRRFRARVFSVEKTRVELRVYVTDRSGRVLFDSRGIAEGEDYSRWVDVSRTLRGEYGARTTNDIEDDPDTAVMYVGAPVWHADQIVGCVTAGRPVASFGRYVQAARGRIVAAGVASGLAFLLLAVLASAWLVRPVNRAGGGVFGTLASAWREMRDALAGRQYVTEYVQTLTHEIKSPLAAIRGAAELLQEPMPDAERARFAGNILREAARTQELADRLLELASLEQRRKLDRIEPVSLRAIAADAIRAVGPRTSGRRVNVALAEGPDAVLQGDPLLLGSAVISLLENAIDFSPEGGTVTLAIERGEGEARISVRDHGAGIPEYAAGRVFERFYSLARPEGGKKGTGLGLVFVREIAALHGGAASLDNAPDGGAVAVLRLPLPPGG